MVTIYVTSAFSKDDKGGNKAGVVLHRPDLSSAQMLMIAKELGYSETAFVVDSQVICSNIMKRSQSIYSSKDMYWVRFPEL